MEVNSIGAGAAAQQNSTSPAGNASLDYDAFLKLLVAELKNQDPTEPMKSTDYVAQLATFSNVEQAIQTNSKLDSLLSSTALAQIDGDGRPRHLLGVIRFVDRRKEREASLERQVNYDDLTGLFTRSRFRDGLQQIIDHVARYSGAGAYLSLSMPTLR